MPDATIWVIDNNSTDQTSKVAERLGIQVVHVQQQGKGYAVRQAFSMISSKFETICMLDGDGTYSTKEFKNACELVLMKNIDMVVGNRIKREESELSLSTFRRGHTTGNKIFSFLFSKLFRLEIKDTLSGWRVFSYPFVKSFTEGASGFEIEMELNTHAMLLDVSVINIDVEYRERMQGSHSKLNTYTDGWRILRRMLLMYRSEKPFLAYGFLSIPWVLLSAYSMEIVISEFLEKQRILHFPTLIGGVGAFIVGALIGVTGMILEKVRLGRVSLIRSIYNSAKTQTSK